MNQKQKQIMTAAAVAVLVLAGGWLNYSAVAARQSALAQLQQEADRLSARVADEALTEQVALLQDEVVRQEAALPAERGIGNLLQHLGQDLSDLGATDRSLTTGAPTKIGALEQIPLNLAFKGSFTAVFDLLDRLSSYDRIVRVERIGITRDPRAGADALSVTARLVTFAQVNEEARP